MGKTQKNDFVISGRVVFKGEPIHITTNFQKRLLVLEVYIRNKYRQEVPFYFMNDNMPKLNNVRKDDWVEVVFQLRGRKQLDRQQVMQWWSTIEGTECTIQDRSHGG